MSGEVRLARRVAGLGAMLIAYNNLVIKIGTWNK